MTGAIPEASDIAGDVHRLVILERARREEEVALWCTQEFMRQFEIEPRDYIRVVPPFDVSRMNWSRIEELLSDKGWYLYSDMLGSCTVGPGSAAMEEARAANPHRPDQELLKQIPDAAEAAGAVLEQVERARLKLAEEFALFCVTDFMRQFKESPADYVIVQPPYVVSFQIKDVVEKILQDKGWSFSDWGDNRFYVAPRRPASHEGASEGSFGKELVFL